jgi:hypothetical protein
MLKCLFVDLTSIQSTIPKSKFTKTQIEKLADSLLETDGAIVPLILSQTGSENGVGRYTIIEGHLTYHAALRAKEKDLRKAEMVNAFVIPADCQQAAIAQLALLSKTKSTVVEPDLPIAEPINQTITPTVAVDRDELFERLSAEIARQLVPLSQQLATIATTVDRHGRMLASAPVTVPVPPPPPIAPPRDPDPIAPPTPTVAKITKSNETSTTTRKKANSKARQQPENLPEVPPQLTPPIVPSDSLAPVTPAKKAATKKTTAPKNSAKSDVFAGIEPEKLVRTLQLINTCNLNELTLKMSKSGIASAPIIATNLVAVRDARPDRIFESWPEIIAIKVPKLNQKVAIEIVNKLK